MASPTEMSQTVKTPLTCSGMQLAKQPDSSEDIIGTDVGDSVFGFVYHSLKKGGGEPNHSCMTY